MNSLLRLLALLTLALFVSVGCIRCSWADGACDAWHGELVVHDGPDQIVFDEFGNVDNVQQTPSFVTFNFNGEPFAYGGDPIVWTYQLLDYRFNNAFCSFSIVYDVDQLFRDDFDIKPDES